MPAAFYRRAIGEYVRPDLRFDLDAYCPSVPYATWNFVAGSTFHQEALAGFADGQAVRIELVPEPGNPHDRRAVALDVNGQRCGYIFSDVAPWYHDLVRALNSAGYAVYTSGTISKESPRSGDQHWALRWQRPDLDDQLALATAIGLLDAHNRVVELLSPAVRTQMREECWYGFSKSTISALRKHASLAPELTWATSRRLEPSERVPIWHYSFTRQDVHNEREQRRNIARITRLVNQRIKALVALEKKAARAAAQVAKEALDREILQLNAQGLTHAAVGARIGVPTSRVERVVRAERQRVAPGAGTPAPDFNEAARVQRAQRALRAVEMREEGRSRQEIALEFGTGIEAVKQLVTDGRFYKAPEEHPDRLARARQARSLLDQGMTRDQATTALGLAPATAANALRDARWLPERRVP